jgi:hypothetical protein
VTNRRLIEYFGKIQLRSWLNVGANASVEAGGLYVTELRAFCHREQGERRRCEDVSMRRRKHISLRTSVHARS